MTSIEKQIEITYGNNLRVRVCGILVSNQSILLVNHKGLNQSNNFWSPPGGGMEFGESAVNALKREFFEETGLKISVHQFLFVHEYLKVPLHAIELFFRVSSENKLPKTGIDPEMAAEYQIIENTAFLSFDELKEVSNENLHQVLHQNNLTFKTFKQKGYFKSQ